MAKMRSLMPLLFAAAIAGCSAPAQRVEAGLVRAGVPAPIAGCMATRMTDRLSVGQLRRVGEVGKVRRAGSIEELIHQLRALNDPKIVDVTATSAALCASGLAR